VRLPVNGHATLWTWRRLIDRMVQRRGKVWPLIELLIGVVVEPVLTRLVRTDPLMVLLSSMPARMLRRRVVAATDVAALRAPAQVEPPTVAGFALQTTGPAGQNVRVNSRNGASRCRTHGVTSRHNSTKHQAKPPLNPFPAWEGANLRLRIYEHAAPRKLEAAHQSRGMVRP
jgi:hypothetical protein